MRFKCITLLGVLAILLSSSYVLMQKEENYQEVAWGYDPTGYLLSAQMFRESPRFSPQVGVSSLQAKELIQVFQASALPESTWVRSVGPPSTQYYSKSGVVGIQYPPGVGFFLSLFNEGHAAKRMNQISIVFILLLGFGLLARSAYLNSPATMGMVALSSLFSIDIIRRMGDTSYSVNVSLIPNIFGIVGGVYLYLYDSRLSKKAQIAAYTLLGVMFGICTSVRITTALILFGLFAWLWGKRLSNKLAFAGGYFLTGVLPILCYQRAVTGNLFQSTYPSFDKTPPTLSALRETLFFYFGQGYGAAYNWVLISLGIGLLGFIYSNKNSFKISQGNRVFWLGAFSIFLLPAGYFLTHTVYVHYYLINSLLSLCWVITIAGIEIYGREKSQPRRMILRPLQALTWVPLLAAMGWAIKTHCLNSAPFFLPGAQAPESRVLPEELRNEKSWILADIKVGTLWYYFNRFAYFAKGASKEARIVYYAFLRAQKSPVFFVQDGDGALEIRKELEEAGAVFKERGKILDAPYFQVELVSKTEAGSQASSNLLHK